MFRRYSHRFITLKQFNKRKFSTNSTKDSTTKVTNAAKDSAKEKTSEEIVADSWVPFLKKYGILIFPSLLFGIVSTDIINNQRHRYWLEKHWPSYVAFVRRYHGFVDEDLEEINRLKAIDNHTQKPVTVVVRLPYGSNTIELEDINGTTSVSEIMTKIRSTVESDSLGVLDSYVGLLSCISFKDSVAELQDSIDNNDTNSYSNSASAIDNSSSNPNNELEEMPNPLSTKLTMKSIFTDSDDDSTYTDTTYLYRSLWNKNTVHDIRNLQSSLIQVNNNQYKIDKRVIQVKYLNVLQNFLDGMTIYSNLGNGLITGEVKKRSVTSSKWLVSATDSKTHVKKAIADKYKRIKDLEVEMRTTTRDIDDINQEINQIKKEIATLQREHLNYFYFF